MKPESDLAILGHQEDPGARRRRLGRGSGGDLGRLGAGLEERPQPVVLSPEQLKELEALLTPAARLSRYRELQAVAQGS